MTEPTALEAFREAIARIREACDFGTGGPPPEIDVRLLTEKVRADMDARLLDRARERASAIDLPHFQLAVPHTPRAARPHLPIAIRDKYSLDELLAYHDEEFVRNAYKALLRREPDAEGFAAQMNALYGQHFSRVDLLGLLRRSPEGRKCGVRVRGLWFAFTVRRLRRIPILGRLLGIALYVMQLPVLARNLERQEVLAHKRERELRGAIDAVADTLEVHGKSVGTAMQQAIESAAIAVSRLQAEKGSREVVAALAERMGAVRTELAQLRSGLAECASHQELLPLANSAIDLVAEFGSQIAALDAQIRDRVQADQFETRMSEVADALGQKAPAAETLGHLQALSAALAGKAGLDDLARSLSEVKASLARKVETDAVDDLFSRDRIEAALRQGDENLDDFYAAFADRFRGTREEIRQRTSIYLPIVQKAGAGGPEAPVLDIGCGRGEWLEVMRDAGLASRGVDENAVMVRTCSELGLDVHQGDAIAYLRALPPGSLGAITGLHIIEHLPLHRLMEVFDEALRALRPGGVAIFETPNPENLLVGACNFWLDPTHRHPMPPEATRFMAMSRGFQRVEILRLHPYPEETMVKEGARELRERFNALLFGAQDYSILAYKE